MYRILPLSSIIVERDERQRRDLTGIDELASSIAQVGLLQPIVVQPNGDNFLLIAGERRLAAHRKLGLTEIATITLADLSPAQSQLIELEENVKRNALPWKDECLAVHRYHSLRLAADPEHKVDTTARELSMSSESIHQRLAIVREMEAGNDLVIKAEAFSTARNLVARAAERKAAAELESIVATIGKEPEPEAEPGAPPAPAIVAVPSVPLLNTSFHEWAPLYDGPRFNFIHCDFPYGVNADKHHQGAAKLYRGYEDSPDVYWTLLSTMAENINRLAADSAHLMFWFSMDFYYETKLALQQMGWKVISPYPLIWFKSDNTGILPDPQRGPRRVYEVALMASRGDRKIVQPVSNCFPAPVVKTTHMSQKSLSMLKHFFRMFVDQHTIMLDPTCGSASAVRAAYEMGAESVLGLEQEHEFFDSAVADWKERDRGIDIEV